MIRIPFPRVGCHGTVDIKPEETDVIFSFDVSQNQMEFQPSLIKFIKDQRPKLDRMVDNANWMFDGSVSTL